MALIGSIIPPDSINFRNRIINGDMRIAQRNVSQASITTSGYYTIDRWRLSGDNTVINSITPSTEQSINAPNGFVSAFLYTNTTGISPLTGGVFGGEFVFLEQRIESFNINDLSWGTVSAKDISISFWVRSSLTGTFGGSVRNASNNRSYPFAYTISLANTWEYKTATVPGDITGTWQATGNTTGMSLCFALGASSDGLATAGSWSNNNIIGVTGQVQLVETTGATWFVTGVQLEVGSVATPFERRPYGTELMLCQRYYHKNKATAPASYFCPGQAYSTTQVIGFTQFPVPMRAAPSAIESSGTASNYRVLSSSGSDINCSAIPIFNTSSADTASTAFTVASGLTGGNATMVYANGTNAYLAWSAEL